MFPRKTFRRKTFRRKTVCRKYFTENHFAEKYFAEKYFIEKCFAENWPSTWLLPSLGLRPVLRMYTCILHWLTRWSPCSYKLLLFSYRALACSNTCTYILSSSWLHHLYSNSAYRRKTSQYSCATGSSSISTTSTPMWNTGDAKFGHVLLRSKGREEHVQGDERSTW